MTLTGIDITWPELDNLSTIELRARFVPTSWADRVEGDECTFSAELTLPAEAEDVAEALRVLAALIEEAI